jgi:hypothetical protein
LKVNNNSKFWSTKINNDWLLNYDLKKIWIAKDNQVYHWNSQTKKFSKKKMSVALFINEQYIKDNSPINGNVDDKYIKSTIVMCQKVYILPILGTALYNEIATEINAGSVSANNTSLLNDYIVDALLYYVLSEGIALFTYKIENKSVVKKLPFVSIATVLINCP